MKIIDFLRERDVLIVWKLDRMGRSLIQLVNLVEKFQSKGANFICVKDNVDTSTPQGRLFFNMIASLAEYEREIIRERTMSGLEAARERGRFGGRPAGLTKKKLQKAKAAKKLYEEENISAKNIASMLGLSLATFYRYLHIVGAKVGN